MDNSRQIARTNLYEKLLISKGCSVYDNTDSEFREHGFWKDIEDNDNDNFNTMMEFINQIEIINGFGLKIGIIIIVKDKKIVCFMTFYIEENNVVIQQVMCFITGYCRLLFYRLYSHNIYILTDNNVSEYTITISMVSNNISACYCYFNSAKAMGFSVIMSIVRNGHKIEYSDCKSLGKSNIYILNFTIRESEIPIDGGGKCKRKNNRRKINKTFRRKKNKGTERIKKRKRNTKRKTKRRRRKSF